jgi:hypothetical protein
MANTEGNSTLLYWGIYGTIPATRQGIGSWYIHAGKVCVGGQPSFESVLRSNRIILMEIISSRNSWYIVREALEIPSS